MEISLTVANIQHKLVLLSISQFNTCWIHGVVHPLDCKIIYHLVLYVPWIQKHLSVLLLSKSIRILLPNTQLLIVGTGEQAVCVFWIGQCEDSAIMSNYCLDDCLWLAVSIPYLDGSVAGACYRIRLPKYFFIEQTAYFAFMRVRNLIEEPELVFLVVSESLCYCSYTLLLKRWLQNWPM